jgi:cytochrome c biogenesis protein CcmG/thiol:disulfide interchange protein DsbE
MNEAPDLQKSYLAYRGKGVFFLGIFTMGEIADIKKFLETYGITFPVGKDKEMAKMFGVVGLPVTIFIAKDGKVVQKHFGLITREELKSNIEAILK